MKIEEIKEELETQKQINKDCEAEYRRVVSQYKAVVEQNKQLQVELNEIKKESKNLSEALLKIKNCAVTEMVEIATRADYNGFLALQGITAKVNQVLKINESEGKQ